MALPTEIILDIMEATLINGDLKSFNKMCLTFPQICKQEKYKKKFIKLFFTDKRKELLFDESLDFKFLFPKIENMFSQFFDFFMDYLDELPINSNGIFRKFGMWSVDNYLLVSQSTPKPEMIILWYVYSLRGEPKLNMNLLRHVMKYVRDTRDFDTIDEVQNLNSRLSENFIEKFIETAIGQLPSFNGIVSNLI